jgi:hypothetical protein
MLFKNIERKTIFLNFYPNQPLQTGGLGIQQQQAATGDAASREKSYWLPSATSLFILF